MFSHLWGCLVIVEDLPAAKKMQKLEKCVAFYSRRPTKSARWAMAIIFRCFRTLRPTKFSCIFQLYDYLAKDLNYNIVSKCNLLKIDIIDLSLFRLSTKYTELYMSQPVLYFAGEN